MTKVLRVVLKRLNEEQEESQIIKRHCSDSELNNNSSNSNNNSLVSSTVSDDLINLNIDATNECNSKPNPLVQNFSSETDEDILSVCCNDDDYTKFCDENLSPNHTLASDCLVSSTKRSYDKINQICEPAKIEKANKISRIENRYRSQPVNNSTDRLHIIKHQFNHTQPLPSNQMAKVSSTHSDLSETKGNNRVLAIFKNICAKYLLDECDNESCLYIHDLPQPKDVRNKLEAMAYDEVQMAYSHVKSIRKLLHKYFCTFCEYFAQNGYKDDLMTMMRMCNDPQNEMQSYLAHVLDGLIAFGVPFSQALLTILEHQKQLTDKTIFVLTNMIFDKRNDNVVLFLKDLKFFFNQLKFKFSTTIATRLFQICIDSFNTKLFVFARYVLNSYNTLEAREFDPVLLETFYKMNSSRAEKMTRDRANRQLRSNKK